MSVRVRTGLYQDESMANSVRPFVKMFLSDVIGVVLRKRGDGNTIIFEFISEDDGHWFPYSHNGASMWWIENYIAVLEAAKEWCVANAVPDRSAQLENGDLISGMQFPPGTVEWPWNRHPRI